MSYVLTAIVSMVLGAIVTSCFALKSIRAAEKKVHGAYTGGYKFGFKAGLRRGKALQRVDTAPGFDSIRPRVEINKPITGLRISEVEDDYIKRFLVDMFGNETEAAHD